MCLALYLHTHPLVCLWEWWIQDGGLLGTTSRAEESQILFSQRAEPRGHQVFIHLTDNGVSGMMYELY